MSRFEALEALTRVGLDVDPETRRAVERGRVLRKLLEQPRFTVRSVAGQIMALTSVAEGWLDGRTPADAKRLLWRAVDLARVELPEVVGALDDSRDAPEGWKEAMHDLVARELAREAP